MISVRMAMLLALLSACSGTTTSPTQPVAPPPPAQPPPPPAPQATGIAAVQLVTDTGTIFTGNATRWRPFVANVIDSSGNIVTNATLSLTASPGWTVQGDTVVAPLTEVSGAFQITATRGSSSATSRPITLTAIERLGLRNPTVSPIMCHTNHGMVENPDGGVWWAASDSVVVADSILMFMHIKSILYAGDPTPGTYWNDVPSQRAYWQSIGLGGVWNLFRDSMIVYSSAASQMLYDSAAHLPYHPAPYEAHFHFSSNQTEEEYVAFLHQQRPDTLVFLDRYPAYGTEHVVPFPPLVRQATTYGGSGAFLCGAMSAYPAIWSRAGNVTVTLH